ncbi:MAG: hypothetical protein FJ146_03350 [Deltaproteobacteria bacterium]|nr:hypothetical protein [Deltaproteobacteria bacterium]
MELVVIAAAKFELDPLVSGLQEKGINPLTKLVGIGALNAAKRSRLVADACRGRHVVFVGTCGTFGSFSKMHLIRASEVLWLPTCERMQLSYTVKDTAPPIVLPPPPQYCASLPERRVVCSPGISLVSKLPDSLSPDHCVENLELYSCINEVINQAVSLSVVLAVTNAVGPDSHTQWRQHFAGAAGATAEYLCGRLARTLN